MRNCRDRIAALALLLTLWVQLALGSRQVSLSMDEPAHIAVGYTYLARGAESAWIFESHGHPPLLNALEAVLIYASHPDIPLEDLDGWNENLVTYTSELIPYLLPLERTEVLARMPIMLMTVLMGALMYRWAGTALGSTGGALALAILSFDPLVLAHGRLATTDAGLTTLGAMTLFTAWRWRHKRRWSYSVATGILLGLTLLAKYSAILYVPVVGFVLLWKPTTYAPSGKYARRTGTQVLRAGLAAALPMVLAGLLVWAAFGFSQGIVRAQSITMRLPAPPYWRGLLTQMGSTDQRIFIAFGQQRAGSHWWYFPLNLVIKNPIPLLLWSSMGFFVILRSRSTRYALWPLLAFAAIYALTAICTGMNVSYRHMLPAHPLLSLMAASGLTWSYQALHRHLPSRVVSGGYLLGLVLVAWYILGTLRYFGSELAYFSEVVGGSLQAPHVLVDYTQDWGQAYKALRAYLNEFSGSRPYIFAFTSVRPEHYGIEYESLDEVTRFHPQPGRYVLGSAPLYGLVGPDHSRYDWFRRATPTAFVGHSLFIYQVDEQAHWIAQCTQPVAPLDDQAVVEGFGSSNLRRIPFDCTQSWIYPVQLLSPATSMGSYALHDQLLASADCSGLDAIACEPSPQDGFVARHLTDLRLAYAQPAPGLLPPFALYEPDEVMVPSFNKQVGFAYAAAITTRPSGIAGQQSPVEQPHLEGRLQFLGISLPSADQEPEVETWWRVTQAPLTHPFSIFCHLVTTDGTPVAAADGMGISSIALEVGDIIVQRHILDVEAVDASMWLRTGAYWSADSVRNVDRWQVRESPDADALFVPIEWTLDGKVVP